MVSGVLAGAPTNTIREGCQIHDVAHEGAFLKAEVIRRKNRHNRFGVLRMNPMCRKQDSGGRSAILRLSRNALSGRVAQQRLGPDDLRKLLRASSPQSCRTRGRSRTPAPPASTIAQGTIEEAPSGSLKTLTCTCIIFESFKTSELSLRSRLQYSLSPSSRLATVS
jgi:hypothetical protein